MPTLQNSYLGWIISGNIENDIVSKGICNLARIIPEHEQLKTFWKVENVYNKVIISKDDTECEKHFYEHTYRNIQGQFVVRFPLKLTITLMEESYEISLKRFKNLERKFKINEKLMEE